MPPLVSGYGPALIDRAICDALCRSCDLSFRDALWSNIMGITPALTPDLAGFDLDQFLGCPAGVTSVAARHTIGIIDPLFAGDRDPADRLDDGLPETLDEVIDEYGIRYFKIKIGGDVDADHDRLLQIARCLDRITDRFAVTIDGNEQYRESESLLALLARIEESPSPALQRLWSSTLFLEQPITRDVSATLAVHDVCRPETGDDR